MRTSSPGVAATEEGVETFVPPTGATVYAGRFEKKHEKKVGRGGVGWETKTKYDDDSSGGTQKAQ